MSLQDATETVKISILEYKMAIALFILFSLSALCSALMIALANTTWSTLDGQGKLMIVVAVIWNWTTTITAFILNQAKRIKKTGDILPLSEDDNTQQFTKVSQQTQVVQTTVKPTV